MALPTNANVPDLTGYNWLPYLASEYQTVLRRGTILDRVTNTDPDKSKFVANKGDTMRIPIMPQVRSTRAEVGYQNAWADPQPDYIDVVIDRLRYWDLKTYDAQEIISQIRNYGQTWATNAAINATEDIEEEIFGELAALVLAANQGLTAGAKTGGVNMGTLAAPRTIASAEGTTYVLDAILEGGVVLGEQNVDSNERNVVFPDLVGARLMSALRKANEMGDATSVLRAKSLGKINNMEFFASNRLPTCAAVASKPVLPVLFIQKSAIAFHVQAGPIEKIRLESSPAWGYRSEILYGYKLVQPKALALAYYTIA